MTTCTRLTALAMAAALTAGSFSIAQDSPMPKQQKVPPMTGPEGGITAPNQADGNKGGMMNSMEADKTVNMQLAEYAAKPEKHDAKFALMAGCVNMKEVEFGKAVAMKASDPEVKKVAQMMVDEHGMAQSKLKPIGEKLGVTYPTQLGTTEQIQLNGLKSMPVDKMEKAYLSMMKAGHLNSVVYYTDHTPMIQDSELKAYATETLPKIRMHTGHVMKAAADKGMPVDLKFDTMGASHGHAH